MPDVTVTGNENTVIVAGGDVYLPTAPGAPSTGDDRRNLLNLLEHVRRIWIDNVLERSVSRAALLDPQVRVDPGAVEPPWRRYVEAAGQPAGLVPPGTTVGQVFGEVGRMLLILGEPGAGKTTTLLTLARECIGEAERDPSAPVPVVLNLSSWTGTRPLRDWLVDELRREYRVVGKAFALRWLEDHRLLLLLDGLDEVAEDRRAACVEALHEFVEEHGIPGLAVCCRTTEYRALPVRLKLGGAVLLLPLEQPQIDAYLDAAGPGLGGLRAALSGNMELRHLSASPLMLSIMTLAFHGLPPDALRFDETSTHEELREEIFSRFVDRVFAWRGRPDGGFSRGHVEDGLRWLALGMKERGSIFAVELLQPACLTPRQLLFYTIVSRVAGGIALAAVTGAVVCLGIYSLILITDPPSRHALASTSAGTAAHVVAMYLVAAVAFGIVAGLLYAPLDYLRFQRSRRAPPRAVKTLPELMLYLGVVAVTILVIAFVFAVGSRVSRSPQVPLMWAGLLTLMASAPSLPLFFWDKPGRGTVEGDIRLVELQVWNWRKVPQIVIAGVIVGGIIVSLATLFGVSRAAAVMLAVLATFMSAAFNNWHQEVPPVERWTAGMWGSSLLNSGKVFVSAVLAWIVAIFSLTWWLGWRDSPDVTLFIAVLPALVLSSPALFWFGGIDLVLHAALRLVLSLTGTMPLRLRRFLDYAVHLGFLQRAGGGYIFFHPLLLEHFAARPPSDGGSAAGRPASPLAGPGA